MTAQLVPAFYDDLGASYDEAWRLIARGVSDRRSAFHTPAVATIGVDGCPTVRTVVLRGADPATGQLRFHTDRRARKVAEIDANPKMSLHVYDKKPKIQVRINGQGECHTDGPFKDAAWTASQAMSRECYRVNKGPGTQVGEPDDWLIARDVDELDVGKENFVAVSVRVQSIEWLYLARGGHRRAIFHLDDKGTMAQANWLVP